MKILLIVIFVTEEINYISYFCKNIQDEKTTSEIGLDFNDAFGNGRVHGNY